MQLFQRVTIGKYIQAALREELDDSVVAKFATTASDGKTYHQVEYYNLDMIISVGSVLNRHGVSSSPFWLNFFLFTAHFIKF